MFDNKTSQLKINKKSTISTNLYKQFDQQGKQQHTIKHKISRMDEFDPVEYYEYRRKGIHFQEELFGKTFVYVGGRELTAKICKKCSLSPDQKVCVKVNNPICIIK